MLNSYDLQLKWHGVIYQPTLSWMRNSYMFRMYSLPHVQYGLTIRNKTGSRSLNYDNSNSNGGVLHVYSTYRPCFHKVTVVRKIVTQSECNFFSLPSLRENSDDMLVILDAPGAPTILPRLQPVAKYEALWCIGYPSTPGWRVPKDSDVGLGFKPSTLGLRVQWMNH